MAMAVFGIARTIGTPGLTWAAISSVLIPVIVETKMCLPDLSAGFIDCSNSVSCFGCTHRIMMREFFTAVKLSDVV